MPRQIALLRGINLGPNRRIAMPQLRELLTGHGYGDVRTYVQSGNVVLTSDAAPEKLVAELERHLARDLDLDVQVVVRTRDELADVIARDPFADVVDEPKRYQVTFLSGKPDRAVVKQFEAGDWEPERVAFSGREIYAWHPNGIGRSELAKQLAAARFGVTATARNWNTVLKLLELADE